MTTQKAYTIEIKGTMGGEVSLSLSGHLKTEDLNRFLLETEFLFSEKPPQKLMVDLAGIEYLDSAGALGLLQLEDRARANSIPFQFVNVTGESKRIMGLINREALKVKPLLSEKGFDNVIEQVGESSFRIIGDFVGILTFLGDLILALFYSFIHPGSIRLQELLFYMKRAGVEGLPIVGMINFLFGLIIAFMSSLQLKQFGANVYVASLVGVAMVSELGPIMTAVIFAGRSGSAFAAEIGTMKVNEEVDALMAMGFNPTRFLAIPKVLASMMVVPILTLYADFFGYLRGTRCRSAGTRFNHIDIYSGNDESYQCLCNHQGLN